MGVFGRASPAQKPPSSYQLRKSYKSYIKTGKRCLTLDTGCAYNLSDMEYKDYYKILGVDRKAKEDEIKRAYRKLVSQYHPHKLVSRGLPEEMMDIAKRKTQDIQAAYELINQHRQD